MVAAVVEESVRDGPGDFGGSHEELLFRLGPPMGFGLRFHFLALVIRGRIEQFQQTFVAADVGLDIFFQNGEVLRAAFAGFGSAGGAHGGAVGLRHLVEAGGEDFIQPLPGEREALVVQLAGFRFDPVCLDTLFGGVERIKPAARRAPVLPVIDRFKHRSEPEVVLLGNRVVTMVVALGAAHR